MLIESMGSQYLNGGYTWENITKNFTRASNINAQIWTKNAGNKMQAKTLVNITKYPVKPIKVIFQARI